MAYWHDPAGEKHILSTFATWISEQKRAGRWEGDPPVWEKPTAGSLNDSVTNTSLPLMVVDVMDMIVQDAVLPTIV